MAPCTSCLLSRSSNCCFQHFCDVCKYMFRMDQSNGHNNQCSNHVFKVYAYCHHCSTVHKAPNIILGSTMLHLSNSSLSNTSHQSLAHHHPMAVNNESTIFQGDDDMDDNDDSSTSNHVDIDSNCLRDSSDSNESFSFLNGTSSTHGDSKVFFNGLNGHKFYYNSSQDKIGFIPHNTDDIPVPPQFQIPSSCQLSMSLHELELMLIIKENFLSPSIFDKVMKWAHSVTANGYKFDSPTYSTLKKQMNYTFPNTIKWMVVLSNIKSKVVFLPDEVRSDLPVTMWYFENSFGVVCKVPPRSSSHEWLCLFSPEEIYWLWIMCVWQEYISWLVLWSIQQVTCHWKWNASAPARVFICWYQTLWWFFKYWMFDEELRASFPTNYTKSDTRALHCQSSDSWMLVSLLPDLEVSDLEKYQSNQKSNGDNLSLRCLKLWGPQML